jgi:hypothetical protein
METTTVNSSKYWFLQQKEGWIALSTAALLFPPPLSYPEPLPTPIILYLDALKDKWQGSNISFVLRVSNHANNHTENSSKCWYSQQNCSFHHLHHGQSLNPPYYPSPWCIYKLQGSTISVVLRGSKLWKQSQRIIPNAYFHRRLHLASNHPHYPSPWCI